MCERERERGGGRALRERVREREGGREEREGGREGGRERRRWIHVVYQSQERR